MNDSGAQFLLVVFFLPERGERTKDLIEPQERVWRGEVQGPRPQNQKIWSLSQIQPPSVGLSYICVAIDLQKSFLAWNFKDQYEQSLLFEKYFPKHQFSWGWWQAWKEWRG